MMSSINQLNYIQKVIYKNYFACPCDNFVCQFKSILAIVDCFCGPLVAGAWTERKKMYHGGSFLKLAEKVTFPHFLNGHFQCPKQKSETTFQYKYTPY